MHVIFDPHNYGFIYDSRTGATRHIGTDVEGTNLFADFWGRMVTIYKNYPNVLFGLMNEPNQQNATQCYLVQFWQLKLFELPVQHKQF
jgi:aryl-phospho-beta-D-glucosidase BglC (GH1 family)